MRPLRYSINVTLDGCVDHREPVAVAELHRHAEGSLAGADALLFGRVTYQMMEDAWRPPASDAVPERTQPFARVIDAVKKYVVSSTLDEVDWNAELLRGDLEAAVRELKAEPGDYLLTGGVALATERAALGRIDGYEFVFLPLLAGHGPCLLAGLPQRLEMSLVDREGLGSGVVVMRYVPAR